MNTVNAEAVYICNASAKSTDNTVMNTTFIAGSISGFKPEAENSGMQSESFKKKTRQCDEEDVVNTCS